MKIISHDFLIAATCNLPGVKLLKEHDRLNKDWENSASMNSMKCHRESGWGFNVKKWKSSSLKVKNDFDSSAILPQLPNK